MAREFASRQFAVNMQDMMATMTQLRLAEKKRKTEGDLDAQTDLDTKIRDLERKLDNNRGNCEWNLDTGVEIITANLNRLWMEYKAATVSVETFLNDYSQAVNNGTRQKLPIEPITENGLVTTGTLEEELTTEQDTQNGLARRFRHYQSDPLIFGGEITSDLCYDCVESSRLSGALDWNRTLMNWLEKGERIGLTHKQISIGINLMCKSLLPQYARALDGITNPTMIWQQAATFLDIGEVYRKIKNRMNQVVRNVGEDIQVQINVIKSLTGEIMQLKNPNMRHEDREKLCNMHANQNIKGLLEPKTWEQLQLYKQSRWQQQNQPTSLYEAMRFIRETEALGEEYRIQTPKKALGIHNIKMDLNAITLAGEDIGDYAADTGNSALTPSLEVPNIPLPLSECLFNTESEAPAAAAFLPTPPASSRTGQHKKNTKSFNQGQTTRHHTRQLEQLHPGQTGFQTMYRWGSETSYDKKAGAMQRNRTPDNIRRASNAFTGANGGSRRGSLSRETRGHSSERHPPSDSFPSEHSGSESRYHSSAPTYPFQTGSSANYSSSDARSSDYDSNHRGRRNSGNRYGAPGGMKKSVDEVVYGDNYDNTDRRTDSQRYEARQGGFNRSGSRNGRNTGRNTRRQSRSPYSDRARLVYRSPGGTERDISRSRLMIRGSDGQTRNRPLSRSPSLGKVVQCKICGSKHRGKCNLKSSGRGRSSSGGRSGVTGLTPFPVHALEVKKISRSGN